MSHVSWGTLTVMKAITQIVFSLYFQHFIYHRSVIKKDFPKKCFLDNVSVSLSCHHIKTRFKDRKSYFMLCDPINI